MGISRLSAYIIASTDVEALANGPDDNGKYQGIIAHGKLHPHHPYMPILSTVFYYGSEAEAVKAMQEQIELIKQAVAKEGGGNEQQDHSEHQ